MSSAILLRTVVIWPVRIGREQSIRLLVLSYSTWSVSLPLRCEYCSFDRSWMSPKSVDVAFGSASGTQNADIVNTYLLTDGQNRQSAYRRMRDMSESCQRAVRTPKSSSRFVSETQWSDGVF